MVNGQANGVVSLLDCPNWASARMVVAADGDNVNWTDQNCKALDQTAAEDGVFWMEEQDFNRVFTDLYTCMVCAAVTVTALEQLFLTAADYYCARLVQIPNGWHTLHRHGEWTAETAGGRVSRLHESVVELHK